MANHARFTIKAQRDKLVRFSASKIFVSAKPGTRLSAPPSRMLAPAAFIRGDVRAGACMVHAR